MKYEVWGLEGAKSYKIEHNMTLIEAYEVARDAQGSYSEIIITTETGAIVKMSPWA